MTQEDKELLLKDLCARLPYGVKFHYFPEFADGEDPEFDNTIVVVDIADEQILDEDHEDYIPIRQIKPYLRPMSSMTEEECVELSRIRPFDDEVEAWKYIKTPVPLKIANIKHFDFFHSHHLDLRGLIEKGLALEAPEGMYSIKKK